MQIRNKTDRLHLVCDAMEMLTLRGVIDANEAEKVHIKITKMLEEHRAYIIEHGDDPDYITNWKWGK